MPNDTHEKAPGVPTEHYMLNAPYPSRCACGWTPELGESVMRALDRHLLDVAEAAPPAEPAGQVVPPRVGQVVTVTGVVRTVEAIWPDGHYRITVDGDGTTPEPTPLTDDEAHEVYMSINYLDDELGAAREVIDRLIAARVKRSA